MAINIKINKSTNDLNKLRMYLRAVPKWGKSTLFRNIILEEYDNKPEKGLLISLGAEYGETLLDELQCTHVDNWKELKELQNWLIKEKGKEHNIEMIAFDVIDELIPIAETEICRMSQIETGKVCKSINSAYNGYGMGQTKLKLLLKNFFNSLYKAGFGIMAISHTKIKTITEKNMNPDEGYMVLTSNLPNTYENIFSDIFDCILTGTIEKTITDGKLDGIERRLYFRGDGYVEAGTRFSSNSIPEYLVVDDDPKQFAKTFIHTLKEGMRLSATNPIDKEQVKKEVQKEKKETEKELEKIQEQLVQEEQEEREENIEELKTKLKALMTSTNVKNKVKEYMKSKNIKSVKDLSIEQLEELIGLLS